MGDLKYEIAGSASSKFAKIYMSNIPDDLAIYFKYSSCTYMQNSGSVTKLDDVLANYNIKDPIYVDSEHNMSDYLGLRFKVPSVKVASSRNTKFYTKTE